MNAPVISSVIKDAPRAVTKLCLFAAFFSASVALAAPAALPAVPVVTTVLVPAGPFISGSDRAEREFAYQLDETGYGHSSTREQDWYENEPDRQTIELPAFRIMRTLVSNTLYAQFIKATSHPAPDVDRETWDAYGLIHPFERSRPFAWQDKQIPAGKAQHPVVMVSRGDAQAFAQWLTEVTGKEWSLPSEQQWEKAARGTDGRYFPWGNSFDASLLNTHDAGPFSTVSIDYHRAGASPFGMLDAAGQVFEWTSTARSPARSIVKGGSWDDIGCGLCRPAARHSRPDAIKHILVGFRLVTQRSFRLGH